MNIVSHHQSAKMEGVDKEFEKAAKKQKTLKKTCDDALDKMLQSLQQSKLVLTKGTAIPPASILTLVDPSMGATAVASLEKKLTDLTNDINGQVKEYYGAMSKFSKAIEKVRGAGDAVLTGTVEILAKP